MPQVTKPKPMDNQLQTANWTSAYSNWIPDPHSLCKIIHFYYIIQFGGHLLHSNTWTVTVAS